jgi:hypothetical protein
MDQVVLDVLAAIEAADWERVKPLLHPYLRWTFPGGRVVRGRAMVLGRIARRPPTGLPVRYELRDGQVYRWVEAG